MCLFIKSPSLGRHQAYLCLLLLSRILKYVQRSSGEQGWTIWMGTSSAAISVKLLGNSVFNCANAERVSWLAWLQKQGPATYSAAAILDGEPGQYFTFPNEGLGLDVAFRRHGFTCPQEKSWVWGFGFGFCLCRSSSFCPLLSWEQRAGSGSLSQDAEASSPACPPAQPCLTLPAMLAVPLLVDFFAVPFFFFAKCFCYV